MAGVRLLLRARHSNHLLESGGFVFGKVREYFAVKFDIIFIEERNQLAVGKIFLARGGVDFNKP